ncbi:phosphatase PAP2 family protein [Erythrobacter sp. MTPC3]|uniref:phosphatase PAP2 family protein n=1 Tax=Erythrobacter sp. MTPC3 TaxID=3056564 RepID=UPI0036F3A750
MSFSETNEIGPPLPNRLFTLLGDFDHAVLDWLDGPRLVEKRKRFTAVRDITALGGDAFLIVGGLLACSLQASLAGPIEAARLFTFLAIGRALGWALKAIFQRKRPSGPVAGVATFTSSFPSIHTLSAVSLFTGIGFVASHGDAGLSLACGAVLGVLVGSTRLIFRVHWPSDVLTGFALGLIYSTLALSFLL